MQLIGGEKGWCSTAEKDGLSGPTAPRRTPDFFDRCGDGLVNDLARHCIGVEVAVAALRRAERCVNIDGNGVHRRPKQARITPAIVPAMMGVGVLSQEMHTLELLTTYEW